MAVTKLGHVALKVLDLDAALDHYTRIVGLTCTARSDDSAYLRARDDQDHHCIVLTQSDSAGLRHIGLKVSDLDDLGDVENLVEKRGGTVTRLSAGEELALGEAVRFELPSGQQVVLYQHIDNIGYLDGMDNPDPVPTDEHALGIAAARLDHLLISAPDTEEVFSFMNEVLDFDASEVVVDPTGRRIAAWMYCTNSMHDVAIAPGPPGSLHHVAFWADNRHDVIRGVDLLKRESVRTMDQGIARHGISGATTVYFHDSSGNRNELFSGPYLTPGVPGRVEPIVWDLENFPRGVFYYEAELDPGFLEEVS